MVKIADLNKTVAMVFGVVLLAVGLLGFLPNPIIGEGAFFGANMFHHILHIVGGVLGIMYAKKGGGRGYNQVLGGIAALVAVLGFIGPTAALLGSLLGANFEITVLHAAIALVTLGTAYGAK